MKKLLFIIGLVLASGIGLQALAGHGHYNLGVGGIKGGTLPGPGVYYKMYNVWYTADHNRAEGRKKNTSFDIDSFAVANRFIRTWDCQVLGADIVSNLILTVVYNDMTNGPVSDNKWGMSDMYFEPATLSWHGERWDAMFGVGVHMPAGYTDKDRPASPGKHFWTAQANLGGTWFFDQARTWSLSGVARYEVHAEERRSGKTRGNDFHVEWGLGKSFGAWEVGVAGYAAWQPTRDTGGNSSSDRYQAYALGPEIIYRYTPWGLTFSLRSVAEFGVRNGSEGIVNCLSITVTF